MRFWTLGSVAIVAAGVGGCENTEDSGFECGAFSACGGDIRGTWVLQERCGEIVNEPECAYLQDDLRPKDKVTLTFDEGLMTTVIETFQYDYEYALTAPCLSARLDASIVSSDVEQACMSLTNSKTNTTGTDESTRTCTWTNDACACKEHIAADAFSASTSYRVTGNFVTYTYDLGNTDLSLYYCASGNFLTLRATSQDGEAAESHSVFTRR